jgi:hypothetical protein
MELQEQAWAGLLLPVPLAPVNQFMSPNVLQSQCCKSGLTCVERQWEESTSASWGSDMVMEILLVFWVRCVERKAGKGVMACVHIAWAPCRGLRGHAVEEWGPAPLLFHTERRASWQQGHPTGHFSLGSQGRAGALSGLTRHPGNNEYRSKRPEQRCFIPTTFLLGCSWQRVKRAEKEMIGPFKFLIAYH